MGPLRWISTRAVSLAVVLLETAGSLGAQGSTGAPLGWDLLLEGLACMGRLDGKGNYVLLTRLPGSGSGPTPGSVLLSQPSSTLPGSVTTGSGALWDLATGCLPHCCLSGHDPGALPSCPHLNLSGKPSWLSSGPSTGLWGSI